MTGGAFKNTDTSRAVSGISWAVAGGFAAWAGARIVSVDRARRAETVAVPALTFTPQVARLAPWAALALRLAGRRRPAAAAAAAAAALNLVVRTRKVPKPQPGACGPLLRILTHNMYFGRADAEILVGRVRQLGADVLFLQELTEDAVTRLKQAGLDDLMPYTQLDLRGGSRGSGIYARFPLSEGPALPAIHMAQPTALLELPSGQRVELVCVHPVTPRPLRAGATQWREEIGVLPPPGDLPRILAGDFNATLDHAVFRDVLRLGYADAGLQAGDALTPTWGPPGRDSALFTLDHVLVDRNCAVLGYSVHFIPDTDHRAVYAEIQLPERPLPPPRSQVRAEAAARVNPPSGCVARVPAFQDGRPCPGGTSVSVAARVSVAVLDYGKESCSPGRRHRRDAYR